MEHCSCVYEAAQQCVIHDNLTMHIKPIEHRFQGITVTISSVIGGGSKQCFTHTMTLDNVVPV